MCVGGGGGGEQGYARHKLNVASTLTLFDLPGTDGVTTGNNEFVVKRSKQDGAQCCDITGTIFLLSSVKFLYKEQ